MFMFTRTHARLAASDAKKIGEQAKLIEKQRAEIDECKATSEKVFRANLKLAAENAELKKRNKVLQGCFEVGNLNEASMLGTIADLRARLSIFTAPRKRNSRGWFVSGKQEQAA